MLAAELTYYWVNLSGFERRLTFKKEKKKYDSFVWSQH